MESELDKKQAVEAKVNSDGQNMHHDSMVTVRLSEPPVLTLDTKRLSAKVEGPKEDVVEEIIGADMEDKRRTITDTRSMKSAEESSILEESPRITMLDPNGNEVCTPTGSETAESEPGNSRRDSDSSETSLEEVNWEELEKKEERQPRNQDSEDSTALLLARLEKENNDIASNPKAGIAKAQTVEKARNRAQSRPPSMQHLKKLVNGPTPSSLRYSVTPPPPMTDLEFYAALVQDYPRTAQYLPTLLSKKIRSGIPPPLRGVVWQSMSGARDRLLEEEFERLCGESSPYEGIIGKDLGRSFPGVEMFRDPEGDGQRMLGRVLKCFSLYDHKIGYCQGLGFLVGPLLMHMGDKQAFCVLVRLMEHYDLRNCFLPDLSGLHVRIHQFRELLKQHLPVLSAHLDILQVEPAYVSQWFLSFFAVTCPLPMLFRIYDVIFAEGASATIMRVALSLMRKNETKILSCTEFEDVMQLLLSRGLWDVYHYNADEFVNDFVSLTGIVTHESLHTLEASYRESQIVDTTIPSDVGSAASRFLGRLWAGSNTSTRNSNLSPGLSAPSRPVSFLRKSPSKQSLASTLNSVEGSGSDSMLSSSTDATSVSRDSSNTDTTSIRGQSFASVNAARPSVNKDKNLHSQIEDLLTALSEMQRDHAVLATQLQREREEREEDRAAVRSLLDGLKKKSGTETIESAESDVSIETVKGLEAVMEEKLGGIDADETAEALDNEEAIIDEAIIDEAPTPPVSSDDLSTLLDVVEERFVRPFENRRPSMLLTKSQLREELSRSKEQLITESSRVQEFSRRIADQDQEISNLKDMIRETHAHIRNSHQDRQRLEKQLHDMRSRKSSNASPDGSRDTDFEWPNKGASTNGLRELKLVRSNSQRSVATTFSKRTSSLIAPTNTKENENPRDSRPAAESQSNKSDVDADALVLELVQAKTAEAIAKQEAEEAKAKLESLRKMLGLQNGQTFPVGGFGHKSTPSQSGTIFGGKTMRVEMPNLSGAATTPQVVTAPASGGGGFWGWGKRSVSGDVK
ncbi:hypothetical protein ACMFMG_003509 [Clarireedia jacksonii]